MFAKLIDGKIEVFNGNLLTYTEEQEGITYYVTSVNPEEKEFNLAGYYRVCPDILPEDMSSGEFEVTDNIICKKQAENEETSV